MPCGLFVQLSVERKIEFNQSTIVLVNLQNACTTNNTCHSFLCYQIQIEELTRT